MFADTSKVCKAATYMGFGNEFESFRFKIKVRRTSDFDTRQGMKH